jgi:predicted aldo/keto reductase-like oxidoreductase
VAVAPCGMSSCEQVLQNVAKAMVCTIDFRKKNSDYYGEVEAEYRKHIEVHCTGCRDGMPCSSNVSISECFEFYNQGCMYDAKDVASLNYSFLECMLKIVLYDLAK